MSFSRSSTAARSVICDQNIKNWDPVQDNRSQACLANENNAIDMFIT
jgi:hypothetical protein